MILELCFDCGSRPIAEFGCKVQGGIEMELAEKAGAHVPAMGGRTKVPKSIQGPKSDIPRPTNAF